MLMNLEILFNFCMVMGVTIAISSNNWLMIWLGLELSMMSFIPIMSKKSKLNSESCIKYFIIQSLSSSIMMMGVIMMSIWTSNMILMLSVLLKLGVSPFHTWVVSIIEGMEYYSIFVMLTLMKLSPIIMLSYLNNNFNLFIILSLLVGSISGLNQNSISKIMGYSSIFNMSLILSSVNMQEIWVTFFLMYTISLVLMNYLVLKLNLNFINQMMMNNFKMSTKTCCWFTVLSMGGFPPFMGFFGKLLVIKFLMTTNQFLVTFIMIMTSLIVMFFYTRMVVMSIILFYNIPKWLTMTKMNFNSFVIMVSLILPFILFNLKSL
uniref:NADH-ubiquinone oxidoreductase chain 2 n=1 Tax=Nondenticentrus paramelanicus TaxID=3065213 RepID=A0AA95NQ36_9HEMI|nr:NADH dehydrogenase subunit 2 [Nondenticentrus paramelanicus]WKZ08084.1 NADH dehydrogenase subunit 2 [Nondenticentrus paramelanicus]